MGYALATLWHERQRFLPGVLAVAFSAVLIVLQCGLLLGLFSITSVPVDHTDADVWVGAASVDAVDQGVPIPEHYITRLGGIDGVESQEMLLQDYATWTKPDGGIDRVIVVGGRLEEGAMGRTDVLTPELCNKLTEPFGVVIDKKECKRLGVEKAGDVAEINKQPVRVVGIVKGVKGLAAPFVFCSEPTARQLLTHILPPRHTTYILAKCSSPERAEEVVEILREKYPDDMSAYTANEFSWKTRFYWLTKTNAGVALGYAALLGLLVGTVVTTQTLYAATTASAREYAILLALGIPRWRVSLAVLVQSFYVGLVGIVVSLPCVYLMDLGAAAGGVNLMIPAWLIGGAAAITLVMSILSGLGALRSVRKIQPLELLR